MQAILWKIRAKSEFHFELNLLIPSQIIKKKKKVLRNVEVIISDFYWAQSEGYKYILM